MIRSDITVSYETCDGIHHTMQIEASSDNAPYNIAALTIRMINDSDANSSIVIEDLTEEFGK